MCNVLLATGEVFHNGIDLDLPGFPPFEFKRSYSSSRPESGALAVGWSHNWEISLVGDDAALRLREGTVPERTVKLVPESPSDPVVEFRRGRSEVEVREPRGRTLRFTAATTADTWVLRELVDAHGNVTTLEYDRDGLAALIDSSGREVLCEYVAGWLGAVALRHRGVTARVTYSHDALGQLIEVHHHSGGKERYAYRDGLLVEHVRRSGVTRHMCYDAARRCVLDWFESDLRVRQIEASADLVMVTDSYGYRDVYHLDDQHRIVRKTDALGRAVQWIYAPQGGLLAHVLEDGRPLRTIVLDPKSGALVGADLHGGRTVYYRDAVGVVSRIANANGHELTFERNSAGDILRLTGPEGASWGFEYDARGALTRVINPLGHWIARSDRDGVVDIWDELGRLATYVFDPLGNLLSDTDASGRQTTYRYSGQDRLASLTLPGGGVMHWERDDAGRVTSVQDPNGRVTRYEYTAFGSLRRIVYPHGREILYHFDREENLVGITNGKRERTVIDRDDAYRVRQITFFDGRVDRYEYDQRNRVKAMQLHRDEWILFEYDEAANPTRITFPDGSVQENQYDALENLLSMAYRPSVDSPFPPTTCHFTVDGNHVLRQETVDEFEVTYDHDPAGSIVAIRDSHNRHIVFERTSRREVARVDDGGATFRFAYRPSSEMARIEQPNGMVQRFEYDADARLTRREVLTARGQVAAWRAFAYDAAGQLIGMDDWRLGVRRYQYDAGGRLSAVLDGQGVVLEQYRFDIEGNLLASPEFSDAEVDTGNRIRRAGADRFTYDEAGCLVRWERNGQTREFSYGPFDQLASIRRGDEPYATFEYDLQGRRSRCRTPGEETQYFYHLNTVASFDSSVTGHWDFVYAPGTFIPLSQVQAGRRYYYSFDQIGTPTELWNDQGVLVAAVSAHAFGAARRIEYFTADRPPLPFHFQGQVVDEATGLHYNRFRYYMPLTATFLTHDPIGLALDPNLYVYPRNPLTWIDPFGLAATLEITCGLKTRAFDACEQYAAQQKLNSINAASKNRRKKTCTTCRENEQRDYFIDTCGGNPSSGNQVDHMLELQLGGADYCCDNMMAIPASVNQSFGSQIKNLISGLGEGAVVPKFAFAPPGCDQADKCTNKEAVTQRGTKSDGKDCEKEPALDC